MSNKNNRTKRLEKTVNKQIQDLHDGILELNEENSNLRQLIDLQADCFKEQNKSLRWDIEIHNERFRFQRTRITDLKKTVEDEREKLRKVTDEVIDIGVEVDKASLTFLGRFIFKCFKKGK